MTPGEEQRAIASLWSGLRLVVIDVETAQGPDGHRIISFAAVTCRNNQVGGKWQDFVNPGIPVDAATMRIHGLTDEEIRHHDSFAALAPLVLSTLAVRSGETVILCAHNIHFDVPVLRREFERAGMALPDLPLLDTMRGLTRVAGVKPKTAKLDALLAKLGLTNFAPHDALGDAWSTAEAARQLLNRAAIAGYDLASLLRDANDGTAAGVGYAAPRTPAGKPQTVAPDRPAEHVASHAHLLPTDADKAEISHWIGQVGECARLRCDLLVDRVAAAGPASEILLASLVRLLSERAKAADTAGCATIMGAIGSLFGAALPEGGNRRRSAVRLDEELSLILAPLSRCAGPDLCPSCRLGQPCPLDTWRLDLAEPALGETAKAARGFFMTTSDHRRANGYITMRDGGHVQLADAALRLVHRHWQDTGASDRADQLVEFAWAVGCRDPQIAEAHAMALAAGGRERDLELAAEVCSITLAARAGNTDEAWHLLSIRESQIRGQIERRRALFTNTTDAAGNRVPKRRHHPTNPRRVRPPRFLRSTVAPKRDSIDA